MVLKEYSVPTTYKYYSAPRLDKDAYLLGELPDWGKLNLLPGDANIIFEGTYIGRSHIDPNSTLDTINNETGILTWKLQLEPGESRKLRVSYSVRYPKDKLVNLN